MRFRRGSRAVEYVESTEAPQREVPPPVEAAEVYAVQAVPVAAQEHRLEILRRFEHAAVNRELAIELNTKAERAMLEAIEQHEKARRELRRVSEGHI